MAHQARPRREPAKAPPGALLIWGRKPWSSGAGVEANVARARQACTNHAKPYAKNGYA